MAAPNISVLSEASATAAKQLKSYSANANNSVNSAAESFNQVLAKQIAAKKNNAPEKTSNASADQPPSNKLTDQSGSSVDKTEHVADVDKVQQEDELPTNDTILSPLFTLVENIAPPANNVNAGTKTDKSDVAGTDISANISGAADIAQKQTSTEDADVANFTQKIVEQINQLNASLNQSGETPTPSTDSALSRVDGQALATLKQEIHGESKNTDSAGVENEQTDRTINEHSSKTKTNSHTAELTTSQKEQSSKVTPETEVRATSSQNAQQASPSGASFQEKLVVQQAALSNALPKDSSQSTNSDANINPAASSAVQPSTHTNTLLTQAVQHLAPTVGTRAWDQALGQKVIWLVGGGQQSAELTLNPPDLGPLQVSLNLNNDQLNANFYAQQQEVRDALESSFPKLKQILNDAGLQLAGFSVNAGTQQSQQQYQQTSPQSESSGSRISARSENISVTSTNSTSKTIIKEGLVDTFV